MVVLKGEKVVSLWGLKEAEPLDDSLKEVTVHTGTNRLNYRSKTKNTNNKNKTK